MSDMQDLIIESVTKIMAKYSTKDVVDEAENGKWPEKLWKKLADNGMLTVAVSEEKGGNGGDYLDALSILRLAGKFSAPIPLAEKYVANWVLAELGVLVEDDIITVSYNNDRQDLRFNKTGEGWIVSGRVRNVPWARFAQKILVVGETSDGPVLALVSLEKSEMIKGKNLAGEVRDEVIFKETLVEDCKVYSGNIEEKVRKIFYAGALTRSVMMSGALENILEIVINHTTERTQFGRSLHRFQAIQHHLAAIAGETAAARVASEQAGNAFECNPFARDIAFSKIRVNEAAGKVNTIAHQVVAAIGFTYEHSLHHNTRRLWSWRDEFGTELQWQQIVADELMKLSKNDLWSMITGVSSHVPKEAVK